MTDQTQDARPDGAAPARRAVPDLGFFAGAPAPGGGSAVLGGSQPGGAPSPFGAPAASPFGTPAGSQVPWTSATGPHTQPSPSGHSSGVKAAAAGAAVVLLIGLVLGCRFGWQQFVADPVAPDTLIGMPRVTSTGTVEVTRQLRDGLGAELSSGSKAEVAMYSDGQGSGLMLLAIRGGDRPGGSSGDDTDPFAGWDKSHVDGATCYSRSSQPTVGLGTTVCTRTLWRRAVIVFGVSTQPLTADSVARATNEAWDAQ